MLKWSAHWAYFLLVWKNDIQKILAYILFVKGKIKDKDKKEEQLFSEIRNKLPFLLYHPTPSQSRFQRYHSHRMEQRTRENPHPASREALGSTKMKRKKKKMRKQEIQIKLQFSNGNLIRNLFRQH